MALPAKQGEINIYNSAQLQELALQQEQEKMLVAYWQERRELIRKTVAKTATDAELEWFLTLAAKYNLDPFRKEIWCVRFKESEPVSIFAGRDGHLVIAQRNRDYRGFQSGVVWPGDDFEYWNESGVIKWRHKGTSIKVGSPIGAWAVAWRNNMPPAFYFCPFHEHYRGTPIWNSNKAQMILKCPEGLALKKQFGVTGLEYGEPDAFNLEEAEARYVIAEVEDPYSGMTEEEIAEADRIKRHVDEVNEEIADRHRKAMDGAFSPLGQQSQAFRDKLIGRTPEAEEASEDPNKTQEIESPFAEDDPEAPDKELHKAFFAIIAKKGLHYEIPADKSILLDFLAKDTGRVFESVKQVPFGILRNKVTALDLWTNGEKKIAILDDFLAAREAEQPTLEQALGQSIAQLNEGGGSDGA